MLNIRSLVNKLSKFQSFLYTFNFCIICLTETWLSDFICNGEILPTGFVLYRKDRPSRGGGVLIAVRESLFSSFVPSPHDLEMVCVKLGRGIDCVICCVYIPPECSFSYVSSVVQFLTDLTSSFRKCVVVGDFNFPDIDWSILMGTSNSSNCFCNFVFDCNLTQHVSKPTHVQGNLLDLVLTSASVAVSRLSVFPLSVVDFSDHHAISFDFCCNVSSVPKCNPGYVYDFCNADYESISSFLLESDFSVVFGSSNVEYIWFLIKSLICKAMSLYVPRILVKRRQDPKWFNSNIRHHQKCLRMLRRRFIVQPTLQRENKIRHMENLLQSKLVQAKSDYESELIESHHISNSSAIFSYIRSISVLPSTLHLDDVFAVSDSEKESLFNTYFHSVFTSSYLHSVSSKCLRLPSVIFVLAN